MVERLENYCNENGFPEFADYATKHNVHECVEELTRWLMEDRPTHPGKYLLKKYRDMYPLEHFQAKNDNEIPVEQFIRLFEATRNITHEIVLFGDGKIKMLLLSASNLPKPIRVNPGQGIAGHVFKTGETVNIPDCYQDSRFDSSFDKLTGYHTKSMLVKPINDYEGNVTGVFQAINKENDVPFSKADEVVIENFMQLVGITLRNVEVYKDAIAHCKRAQGMLSMLNSLPKNLGSQSMILTITMHANKLVQADQCTVYLLDEQKNQLWSVAAAGGGKDMRIPADVGICGACLASKETVNVEDVQKDDRFDKRENLCANINELVTMLVVPLLANPGKEKKALGVVLMQNKREFDGEVSEFNEEDIEVMETFAKLAADRLKDSALIGHSDQPKQTEAG
eukprot:gene418-372_t